MLCKINDFQLADGTISGGFALSGLRLRMQRVADMVIELGELNPTPLDRNKRKADISFTIDRIHATIGDAEAYILDHDSTVPRTGDVKLIVSVYGIVATTPYALIVNGAVISHELAVQYGKFTRHNYHIMGAPLFSVTPGTDRILLETGDFILLETGDKILLE